ncbi:MAG: AlpA family phage regulatory protein [Hydrogenophaga sp.]|uniref:helix-turn-helix transcriptional regulator n=1 Tax=Hydrogenophaga sp. TaxID=1904254 RepID=UPI001DB79857|nr:AlpA family phage regulatory protein [Hydrogenophaga sp.]MBW0182593.1 AlpA family phage regulatory protein [Hydrogenophaga sp.]
MKTSNPNISRPQLDPVELSKIIRRPRLCELVGFSRSASYLREDPRSKYFDANFPKSLRIGTNSVGWRLGDVLAYIDSLMLAKGA